MRPLVLARATRAAIVVLACALARDGRAAGFAVQEQSGRGLGSAYAGEAAAAEDASTVFFNPAGMTRLPGTQVVAAGHLVWPSGRFANRGSTLNPAVGGGTLKGGDGPDLGETALVPAFYLTHAISPRWRLGLGVGAPFGLRTEYDRFWVGRYHAHVTDLKIFNVNPSFAVQLLDWLSFGAGADVQYGRLKVSNTLDTGSICLLYGPGLGVPPRICRAVGLRPQQVDGFIKAVAESWAFGWNAGFLVEPAAGTRIGVAYRSEMDHEPRARVDFSLPKKAQVIPITTGALRDGHARVENFDLPDSASLAAVQELGPRWALLGGITWTHWDRFREIVVRFRDPRTPTIVQPEGWDDSFRFALGARFQPARAWTLRAGTAYDETPIPNARLRTPRIPDADRVWLSVGLGYDWSERIHFDAGYAHVFGLDADIENRDPVTGHVLRGSFSGSGEVFGAQVSLRLD